MDSIIEKSGIRPGDSVWVDRLEMDLINHHVIYLGREEGGVHWIVGLFRSGPRILNEEQVRFLIKAVKKARINKFDGDEVLRKKAVDRMIERFDTNTFLLVLRYSENHRQEVAKAESSFSWRKIALGAGLGLGLLTGLGIAISKWKEDKDK